MTKVREEAFTLLTDFSTKTYERTLDSDSDRDCNESWCESQLEGTTFCERIMVLAPHPTTTNTATKT